MPIINNLPTVEDRDVPILYLIRGLPGSGKSTYANSLGCIVIAPSDMMSHRGGNYKWIRENYMISKMHFREIVRRLMALQIDIAITELMLEPKFIQFWLDLAAQYYYKVKIETLLVTPEESLKRNTHDVDHKSIMEVHEQCYYGIPDQTLDFSLSNGQMIGIKTSDTLHYNTLNAISVQSKFRRVTHN
jgi:predicted kinase